MFRPDSGRLIRMIVAYDEKRKKGERVRRARSGAIGVEGLSTGWMLGSLVVTGMRGLQRT
jgi:hypothetical protein